MKEKNEMGEKEEEPTLKRARRNSIIEYKEDYEVEQPKRTRRNSVIAENDTEDTPKIKPVCPGCLPRFQENQLAHYGPNGCLGDEFSLDEPK